MDSEGTPGVAKGWEGLARVPLEQEHQPNPVQSDPAGDTPDPLKKTEAAQT